MITIYDTVVQDLMTGVSPITIYDTVVQYLMTGVSPLSMCH